MFNPETGEIASDGFYGFGTLWKVIEKADFTDKETGQKRAGGFEIEMMLENSTGRDQLLVAKCPSPEQFTGLVKQRIVVALKVSAYQFGERDAQISYTVQEGIPPIRLSNLISAQAHANPPTPAVNPPPVPAVDAASTNPPASTEAPPEQPQKTGFAGLMGR